MKQQYGVNLKFSIIPILIVVMVAISSCGGGSSSASSSTSTGSSSSGGGSMESYTYNINHFMYSFRKVEDVPWGDIIISRDSTMGSSAVVTIQNGAITVAVATPEAITSLTTMLSEIFVTPLSGTVANGTFTMSGSGSGPHTTMTVTCQGTYTADSISGECNGVYTLNGSAEKTVYGWFSYP